MLFHYHFWTPYVEETEKFYVKNGFRISQRIGKSQGDFLNFDPPLKWDDFREKNILFRIIEARKGTVNITFGYGKRVIFDHIGFLVSDHETDTICENADKLNWKVDKGERRTFITTPYDFRIELQTNKDIVDSITDDIKIQELRLETKIQGLENDLDLLFGKPVKTIKQVIGDTVTIREIIIKDFSLKQLEDPNGVRILT
ncbi:hypothetical protein DFO73_101732 [Cytobacillus oceanisediminis]|uniref:VOC domain-containing protein n=1 Tax=Cytobacillus oceanisediminis TaxID=665099 RepID=A0A2V3A5W5_9BACI|nr:hypothetical protein [Cytobacillus oceanisediminis]PWW32467.1 hypothetical protein DFO73_101732 [Cytobacillus oceanisediminis]